MNSVPKNPIESPIETGRMFGGWCTVLTMTQQYPQDRCSSTDLPLLLMCFMAADVYNGDTN